MKSSKPARDAKFDADTRLRSVGEADPEGPLESLGEAIGEVVTGGLVGDRSATGGVGPAAAEDDRGDGNGDTRKRPMPPPASRRQGPSAGG